jgi:hypothetical protein
VLPKTASWEPETTLRRAQIESRLPARILVIVSDSFLFADHSSGIALVDTRPTNPHIRNRTSETDLMLPSFSLPSTKLPSAS